MLFRSAGNVRNVQSTSVTFDTNWHHYVGTFTGSTEMKIYLDGVLIDTDTTGIPTSTHSTAGNTFEFGRWTASGPYYTNGQVSNARIYNKSLTQEEITKNYNAIKGRFGL